MLKIIYLFFLSTFCLGLTAEFLTDGEFETTVQCYREQLGKIHDPQSKFDFVLRSIPADQWYKFFIDKKRLLHPKENEKDSPPHLLFDVLEPGYFHAMDKTFKSLPQYLNREIDLKMSVELHDRAIDNVKHADGTKFFKGISTTAFQFKVKKSGGPSEQELIDSAIIFNSCSLAKLLRPNEEEKTECFQTIIQNNMRRKFFSEMKLDPIKDNVIISIIHSEEEWEGLFAPIYLHFKNSIQNTKTLNGIISAIAELLRALEVAHILPDGNTRTNAFLLLNKLLLDNNLIPVILEDPEMFGGSLTVEELTQAIRHGMKNFLNENPEYHRNLVARQCADMTVDKGWFNNNDYSPYYFDAKPLKKVAASFIDEHRQRIEASIRDGSLEAVEAENSPLYYAILSGQHDLLEELLSKGAKVNSSVEYHPLKMSLLYNYSAIPTILAYYETGALSQDAQKDVLEASLELGDKQIPLTPVEKKSFEAISRLLDPNNPFTQLILGDILAFEKMLVKNPNLLFEKTPGGQSLIKYFQDKFSHNNKECWLKVLELLSSMESFSGDNLMLLSDLLIGSVRARDEDSINSLLKSVPLKNWLKEKDINEVICRKDLFGALVRSMGSQLDSGFDFDKEQFIRVFDALVESGARPQVTFMNGGNNLLHQIIDVVGFNDLLETILLKKKIPAEEKLTTYNAVMQKVLEVIKHIGTHVNKSQKNAEGEKPLDLFNRETKKKKIKQNKDSLTWLEEMQVELRSTK